LKSDTAEISREPGLEKPLTYFARQALHTYKRYAEIIFFQEGLKQWGVLQKIKKKGEVESVRPFRLF